MFYENNNKKGKLMHRLTMSGASLLVLGCSAAVATSQTMSESALGGPPNVVLIIVDDLGYHDLGFTGSDIYDTPSIDDLAKNSMTFSQAYASYPRCTPSRYGLMTATYPVRENKGKTASIPKAKNPIQQFEAAGYNTHFVGKWHLGAEGNFPVDYGFDSSFAAGQTGGAGSHFYPFNTRAEKTGDKSPIPDVESAASEGDYLSDVLTNNAISYIDTQDGSAPFLMVLSYYAVHTPIEAKDDLQAENNDQISAYDFGNTPKYIKEGEGRRKMRQDDAAYAAMVENTDENIGRLIESLRASGQFDNSIIVLTSDHGGLSNDGFKRERHLATTNNPLRAGKGWLYEGGIKVPLIMSWPNSLSPAQDNQNVILGMDLFPTLLDMTIDGAVKDSDGISFEPQLLDAAAPPERAVFWQSLKARPHSTGDNKASAVRYRDYKLIHWIDDDRYELFNIATDPSESSDISGTEPERVLAMAAMIEAWRQDKKASIQ